MFYSHELLHFRNGKLAIVWLAATKVKLPRKKILQVNVKKACEDILAHIFRRNSQKGLSLYLAAQLMYGTGVVYERQLTIIIEDLEAFRLRSYSSFPLVPQVDLPSQVKKKKAKKGEQTSDERTLELTLGEPSMESALRDVYSDMGAFPKGVFLDEFVINELEKTCVARYEDITLLDEALNISETREVPARKDDDFGDSFLFSMNNFGATLPPVDIDLDLSQKLLDLSQEKVQEPSAKRRREAEIEKAPKAMELPSPKRPKLAESEITLQERTTTLDESLEAYVNEVVNERMGKIATSTTMIEIRYAEIKRQVLAELGLAFDGDGTSIGGATMVDRTDIQAPESLLKQPPLLLGEERRQKSDVPGLTEIELGTVKRPAREKRRAEEPLEGPSQPKIRSIGGKLTFDLDVTSAPEGQVPIPQVAPTEGVPPIPEAVSRMESIVSVEEPMVPFETFPSMEETIPPAEATTAIQQAVSPPPEVPPAVVETAPPQLVELQYTAPPAPSETRAEREVFVQPPPPAPAGAARIPRRRGRKLLVDRETQLPISTLLEQMDNPIPLLANKRECFIHFFGEDQQWINRPGPWSGQRLVPQPSADALLSHPNNLSIWCNEQFRKEWQSARTHCLHSQYELERGEEQRRVTSTPLTLPGVESTLEQALSVERQRATLSLQESRRLTQTLGQTLGLQTVGSILEVEEREDAGVPVLLPPTPIMFPEMEQPPLQPLPESMETVVELPEQLVVTEAELPMIPELEQPIVPEPEIVGQVVPEVSVVPEVEHVPEIVERGPEREPVQQIEFNEKLQSYCDESNRTDCLFTDIIPPGLDKKTAAIGFRSLLGLLKKRLVKVVQEQAYGPIRIIKLATV